VTRLLFFFLRTKWNWNNFAKESLRELINLMKSEAGQWQDRVALWQEQSGIGTIVA